MTFVLGKGCYVAIGTSGSETDISAYAKTADPTEKVASLDTTTFGPSVNKTNAPGLVDNGPIKLTLLWNAALEAILRPLLRVEGKSLVIGPEGNGSGLTKDQYPGWLMSLGQKITVAGLVERDIEFSVSGDPVHTTF